MNLETAKTLNEIEALNVKALNMAEDLLVKLLKDKGTLNLGFGAYHKMKRLSVLSVTVTGQVLSFECIDHDNEMFKSGIASFDEPFIIVKHIATTYIKE